MRKILQRTIMLIATLVVSPLVLICKFIQNDDFFNSCGQFLSLFPGKFGSYIRVAFYSLTLKSCSKKGYIGFGSFFSHRNSIVSDGFHISGYCIIGMVNMGKHCSIGSHVSILSGKNQHGYHEIGVPILDQPGYFEIINLGENCFIGERSVIMADLGRQCVVGAGSVVTKSFGDFVILGGNPARILGQVGG
jgi:acetyltransferase-like isoleucine patch superfamily enzyme